MQDRLAFGFSAQTAALSTVSFGRNNFRVVTLEGNPWFAAADVCNAVSAWITKKGEVNIALVLISLERDEKSIFLNPIGGSKPTIISESSPYTLVRWSDRPEAKAFQDWVTREVLPSFRKPGS